MPLKTLSKLFLGFLFLGAPKLFSQELYTPELKDFEQILDSIERADSLKKEEPVYSKDTIEYRALEMGYDHASQNFELYGEAELAYQNAKLTGDTIQYNIPNSTVMAAGDPEINESKNPPIYGKRMKYNFKTKVGQIFYGSSWRDKEQFNGMDIRRLPDGRLLVARGDFTTCDDIDQSSFFFYSRRMVIEPKESITARPVVLNIQDVPVAILPMMVQPMTKERSSGLLTPKYGGDQSKGFYLQNFGYYWALSDYMDWQMAGDLVEGEQGNFSESAAKTHFRYKKLYELDGNLKGNYYLNDMTGDRTAWDLKFQHSQNLTPDKRTTLRGEGSFVSRADVRRQNALERDEILNQQANAKLTYRKAFRNNSVFTADVNQNQNLNYVTNEEGTSSKKTITRNLPTLNFTSSGPLIPEDIDPLDTLAEPEWYNKFQYRFDWKGNHYQTIEEDSIRNIDADTSWFGMREYSTLSYNGEIFDYFNITPSFNHKGFWTPHKRSFITEDSTVRYDDWDPQNGNFGNFYQKYNASVRLGTKLYGFWIPEWGRFTGIMHTVSPEVSYTWAPELDSIPSLAYQRSLLENPYQEKQKTIGLGLGNDWDLKYIKRYEVLSEGDSLGQRKPSYGYLRYLSTKSSINYNFEADSMKWSDINSSVALQPVEDYRFQINFVHTLYDRYKPTFAEREKVRAPILKRYNFSLSRTINLGGDFNAGYPTDSTGFDFMTPWSANISYNYSFVSERISPTVFKRTVSHSSSAGLTLKPTENWSMRYNTHYDFSQGKFAEHNFHFQRVISCWEILFDWTPVGPSEGWGIVIRVIELPDIQINTSNRRY